MLSHVGEGAGLKHAKAIAFIQVETNWFVKRPCASCLLCSEAKTEEKESELFASLELTCDPVLELEFHPTVLMSEMMIMIAFLIKIIGQITN